MKYTLVAFVYICSVAVGQVNSRSSDERVETLLRQMTLEEKIGQMSQVD